MMTVALSIFAFLLFSFGVLVPALRERQQAVRVEFLEDLRLFQLTTVRKHYDTLHDFSYSEILERYRVTDAYDSISLSDD